MHWGPGGTAHFERLHFSSVTQTKGVHWWDQPTILNGNPEVGLQLLLRACAIELSTLYESTGAPIPILGHSFGGWLGIFLAMNHPEMISSLTLLGTATHPVDGYINLGNHLLKSHPDRLVLRDAITEFERLPNSIVTFGTLVQNMMELPKFQDQYWALRSQSIKEKFFEEGAKTTPLHPPSFFKVMEDSFRSGFPDRTLFVPKSVKTRILLGREDPFLRNPESEWIWKKRVPHAEVEWVDSGHFVHLETDPQLWLPK